MAHLTTLKINSYIFISAMFLVFLFFIFAIWAIISIFYPINPLTILIIWAIVIVIQILVSSTIVKLTTRTRILNPGENPFLEEKVRKLAKQAGIPMPKLGIVHDATPNAFVFGLTQAGSTLSVHRGLLEQLNDREIDAVLAHEIGHIKHNDCRYMTILSTIPLIAYFGMNMLLFMRFGGGGRDAGKIMAIMILIGVLSAVIYFITSLLIKRVSRIREFYADAYSAHITKDPQSLASALTKITYGLSLSPPEEKSKSAARSFYIGDVQNAHKEIENIVKNKSKYDLDGDGVIDEHELELAMQDESARGAWDRFGGLFSTHPPTYKRILALKDIEKDYSTGQINEENVYEKVEF